MANIMSSETRKDIDMVPVNSPLEPPKSPQDEPIPLDKPKPRNPAPSVDNPGRKVKDHVSEPRR